MKSAIYNQAKYYEIAFSFVDPEKQGTLFEQFIKKYGKIKVKSILDIGCGPALQLREMAKRGYEAIGLDASPKMLDYLKKESLREGLNVETIRADMNDFRLKRKVDFAYIMMGSIVYTKNNELFLSHLGSVASSLKSGGLYLIENLGINWGDPGVWKRQTWTMRQGKTRIRTTFQLIPKNLLTQAVTQIIKFEVEDNGKKTEFIDRDDLKVVAPEEFKLLVEKNGQFDFLGFFEREKIKLLKKASSNNIALLRRK